MNRYQMAVRRTDKPVYKFKTLSNIGSIEKCIIHCASQKIVFYATNMPEGPLDAAVISFSKRTGIPILVDKGEDALALSAAYSHPLVYAVPPANCTSVIRYGEAGEGDLLMRVPTPEGIKEYVTIVRGKKKGMYVL